MTQRATLDKLVTAIQAERGRHGGEGRKVFFDLDSRADLTYDLNPREVAGFLRSEKNREALRQRLGAESVEYRPTKYHRASGGGGGGPGFIRYYSSPASRDPTRVFVKFSEPLGSSPAHATKKTASQLDREIADVIAKHAAPSDDDDEGTFYLAEATPTSAPLGPEFRSRLAAKRAAMKLVREGARRAVEVWHRWRGGNYMQGLADEEGWSDV
jgi:hypothetical protein